MMLDNELGRSWCRQGDEPDRCCKRSKVTGEPRVISA
jgi:hypothetical protein